MAGETTITATGNLTADPKLRYLGNSGAAMANFTVVSNSRFFKDGKWHDGEPLFLRCVVWRETAESVTESLTKGTRVIVVGRLRQRTYEKDGAKRTIIEMDVDEVGPSLRFATAQVSHAHQERSDDGPGNEDPRANATTVRSGGGIEQGEEPPF